MQNFTFLGGLYSGVDWFESHFVGNPEESFSCVAAHFVSDLFYSGLLTCFGRSKEANKGLTGSEKTPK